jgi:hypothetical protein
MMAKFKAGLLSLRDLFATAWWIFLIVGIGFVVAYQFVAPAPPKKITITTGGESGAYYQFANRYAAILAKNGITLEVKTSAGSLENLARLKNDEAQIGFVQGGVVEPKSWKLRMPRTIPACYRLAAFSMNRSGSFIVAKRH